MSHHHQHQHGGGGCGGTGVCQCASRAQQEPQANGHGHAHAHSPPPPQAVAAINGITLNTPEEQVSPADLVERAWGELLRQEAVRRGKLPRHPDLEAPLLSMGDQKTIAEMLDEDVPAQRPDEAECLRYYESRKQDFVHGRQLHVRHILFAVTPGVDVHKLAVRAEEALLELTRKDCPPGRFAELARELSNCPSGAQGGDLGWLSPNDCADEFANELFGQREPLHGMGLRPRLVHTRYGFHIVEVLARKQGRQLSFDDVKERIAVQLQQHTRAKALHQYMQILAGKALIEGIVLPQVDTPLVQ